MRLRRRMKPAPIVFTATWLAPRAPHARHAGAIHLCSALNADPRINTKIFAIAASLFEIAMDLLDIGFDDHPVPVHRHPPITEPCSAGGAGSAAPPNQMRDGTLHRQRIQPGIVDNVVRALVHDQRLRPERQHLDLLFGPAPARLKFLAERVVLDVIPANPTKTQTPPTSTSTSAVCLATRASGAAAG